jgi:hypothetical protein
MTVAAFAGLTRPAIPSAAVPARKCRRFHALLVIVLSPILRHLADCSAPLGFLFYQGSSASQKQ